MKKIGVLVHALTVEYALEVLNGIFSYFEDKKDVQFFVAQTKDPLTDSGIYEYQSWNNLSLLFANDVDLIIVITGSYATTISTENLGKILSKYKEKPIISVGAELKLQNSYYIETECNTAFDNAVAHLKNKHNCKKIAFLSANRTGSTEAFIRYEAYKNAMQKNKLPINEKLIFEGGFLISQTKNVLSRLYPKKKNLDFDAILCANDIMALGCMQYFTNIGVNVPEELKIIGFDDSTYAAQSTPKLSTMSQQTFEQGSIAAELAYKKLNGEEIPKATLIPVVPLYKQSCGCVSLNNNDDIYRNAQNKLIHADAFANGIHKLSGQFYNTLNSLDSLYRLLDLSQTTETLHHFSNTLDRILNALDIPACFVCFYKKTVMLDIGKDFVLPHHASVLMMLDINRNIRVYDPGIEFDPSKNPFPQEFFENYPGSFMIHPLFSGRKNYGYIVCKIKTTNYSMHSVSMKILINTIASNYEYTRSLTKRKSLSKLNSSLQQSNSTLDIQSKTDELTQILNRRGFMDLGQKAIALTCDANSRGIIFFADLDGLKIINDTYGHDMGDEAIKAAADVLSHALRSSDTVGRLSGDEFGAVAIGMDLSHEEQFREKIKNLCEIISKDRNFPFTLSMSIGAVEFSKSKKTPLLSDLLTLADDKLYIEKKKKHKK